MATMTVRKLQLGIELRRLREAAGRTPAQAARELDCVTAKISRIELGQSGVSMGDLRLLLEFYDTDPEQVAWMVELSRDNRRRGRWTGDRAVFPHWFRTFFDLEADAEDVRIVGSEVVTGLFQTEGYMRALFETGGNVLDGPVDVDSAVRSRQERQAILDKDDPPTVSLIMSESCVRRMIGGPAVMAAQLAHLAELATRPRIQLQIWPFDSETLWMSANFTLLRIPAVRAGTSFTFAYCEDLDDARYVDDPDAIRLYETVWGTLQAAALGPRDTRSILLQLAKQFTEGKQHDPDQAGLQLS